MANDENKIILEFPATNVEIEFGETITFDNISGFLNSDRVTYNGESLTEEIAHLENDKADTSYVDTELAKKMNKANPTGTGSFSLNRKANTTVGSYSVTTGYRNTASGTASHAESWQTTASGDASHAEGESTNASAYAAHSEGETTTASGDDSHAEGKNSTASGNVSHAEGENNTASGYGSHAEGYGNTASGLMAHAEGVTTESSGYASHSEGVGTIANHIGQHVFGTYNVADTSTAEPTAKGNYIEIVGNGTDDDRRRNARTLDWRGNETLMGDLTYNGNKSLTSEISRLDGKIDNLPSPMIFKGTLGVGGTIQSLPDASESNEGYTYKVITDGTYAEQTAKVGDVFTSNGSAWVLIPSGDEDNDTWRAIKVEGVEVLGNGISSGAVDFVGSDNIEVDFDGNGNKVGVKTKNIYTKEEVDDIVYNILPDDTASGSVANFNTSLALPIKSLEIDVNAVQENGTPTPVSPLPISGWSEISVVQTGINIWNGVTELGSFDNTTGEKVTNNNLLRSVNPIPVKPNATYMRLIDASLGFRVFYYDKNMNFLSTEVSPYTQLAITIPSDCYYMNIAYQKAIASVSINYPSTDTSFRAYNPNGNTEVINLGGTYYGGHFTQDKAGHRQFVVLCGRYVLAGTEKWAVTGTGENIRAFVGWRHYTPDKRNAPSDNTFLLCNRFRKGNAENVGDFDMGITYLRFNIYGIADSREGFNTWIANNPTEVIYELETPIIIDLPDGEPIITLNDTNNIFADTGDTNVVFKDSVNGYVEKKIASVQALTLNT